MNYTLKLVPNWEENLRIKSKIKLADSGDYKRSEAGQTLTKRIKELYRLSGEAEIVDQINYKPVNREAI